MTTNGAGQPKNQKSGRGAQKALPQVERRGWVCRVGSRSRSTGVEGMFNLKEVYPKGRVDYTDVGGRKSRLENEKETKTIL